MVKNKQILSLNLKKTHYMLFHFRQKKLSMSLDLKIDNNPIERVSSTKFLGVVLNENLSWNSHILVLVNKLNKNIGILRATSQTPY
jgi:hypothetical protein